MKSYRDPQRQRSCLDAYIQKGILDRELVNELKVYRFDPGELIVRSGDRAAHFWFFVEGRAKVYLILENGKSLLVRFYFPPEIVGDVELFNEAHYICNMQALTPVTCIGTSSQFMRRYARANSDFLIFMCRTLGSKLINFNLISAVNQNYTLETRLASYLAAVSGFTDARHGMIEEINTSNLTELADLLGTSYRHLTRTLKIFRDKGMITKREQEYIVSNRQLLLARAADIYS